MNKTILAVIAGALVGGVADHLELAAAGLAGVFVYPAN